jgi:hypothetical protein
MVGTGAAFAAPGVGAGSAPAAGRDCRPYLRWTWVAAAVLVGFANYPLQVVGRDLEYLPGDPIDNKLNNFILEHGYRWLTGRADSFWDAPSFYPRRGTTAWSDAHIGMLPAYAAFRAAGCSPERAFQGHFLAACLLNFAAAAWALRRLGFGFAAVAAGAYVFAFGLPVVGQTQHEQLVPRFLVPPALVFAWEFLRSPRTWRLAAVAGCCAGQIYLTVYIGYFLVLLLAAGLVPARLRFPGSFAWGEILRPSRRTWLRRGAVVAAAVAATLPLVARHARASGGGVPADVIRDTAPVPASWVTPPRNAYLHPSSARSPLPEVRTPDGEHQMCPGIVVLAALLLVAARGVRPVRTDPGRVAVVAAWATLLLAVLVTRWGGVWLYEPLLALPGAGGIRVPGRVVLVLLFPAGVAVAYAVGAAAGFARRAGIVPGLAVAAAALALVAADQRLVPVGGHADEWYYFRNPLDVTLARQARIAEAVGRHPPGAFVFVFPSAADGVGGKWGLQAEVMRATQDLGVPCVNGWTGYMPSGWGYFAGYRELMTWLTEENDTPPGQLAGLVVVGEPQPDKDAAYEARMRAAYPPRQLRSPPVFAAAPRPLARGAADR